MDIKDTPASPPSAGFVRIAVIGALLRLIEPSGRQRRLQPESGTPVHAAYAGGTLTGTTIADGDEVVIGAITYTFVAALTDPAVPYEVLVGASDSDSLDNLIAAINGAAGEGTLYGTGTDAHPLVSAAAGTGDTMDVTARTIGAAGNDIATTATLTAGGWGGSLMTGGAYATEASARDQLIDGSFLYTATADVSRTSTSGWVKSAVSAL